VFFPIDGHPAALQDERSLASIPPQYGGNWNNEPNGMPHNFHFTTEVHYWFEYDAATPTRLDFTGDDDVWVFVNRRLALDLGGWHPPLDGTVNINAAAGATYGLTTGNVYEIAIFHAERKTTGSSFRLTLSGFNLAPSDCVTDCGDGSLAPGEECDDGPLNQGGYDQCTPSCTLGPRCGDAIVQDQFAEVCDNGVNDGSYGGCAPTCQLGPHCGDGVVQPEYEQCDDAVNAGGYGACSPGCVLGPYCGDGVVTLGYEECDDANNTDSDGCSAACRLEIGVQR
jgi:fibro-slime domain-containing protein